jgi:hypothetical protein
MNTALEQKSTEENLQFPIPDFNRLAPFYRWMEWFSFGPFLSQCRFAFLPEMRNPQTALIIGDGDGRFTARLLQENPSITIDAVDSSAAMLHALERRALRYAGRLRTYRVDARRFCPTRPCDLIVTHFFLDCLSTSEVAELALRIRRHSAAQAIWVISEFALPPGWFGRAFARPLVTALYCAVGFLTGLKVRRLPDHPSALRNAGFTLLKRRQRLGGLLASELWRVEN